MLLWEAFVSQDAHTDDDEHTADALTGAAEFMPRYPDDLESDLNHRDDERNLSLAGTAMLWASITDDPKVLRQELLAIRPEKSWTEINPCIEIQDG